MEIKSVDDFVHEVQNDWLLKEFVKRAVLSNKLLNDTGCALERTSIGAVHAYIKDKKNSEGHHDTRIFDKKHNRKFKKADAYDRLFYYVSVAESLEVSRSLKGYLIRKLNAIALEKLPEV